MAGRAVTILYSIFILFGPGLQVPRFQCQSKRYCKCDKGNLSGEMRMQIYKMNMFQTVFLCIEASDCCNQFQKDYVHRNLIYTRFGLSVRSFEGPSALSGAILFLFVKRHPVRLACDVQKQQQ
mmetsp:Transcript_916/g.2686  ORF Transcript_916/g.2686 Transcript_916/m.2686 type:complete len:123 (-) Transcript_916:3504-3872(-)